MPFCPKCHGVAKIKCPSCGQRKKMDAFDKDEMDRLLLMWRKLKIYKMKTTGDAGMDRILRREFGDWTIKDEPNLF